MKKLLVMLVVMAIVAPVFAADVDFVATNNENGTCTVTYTASVGTIRGMALNIDATAPLTAVAVDSFFDVFMDAAYMNPGAYTLGAGTPIADQNAAGEIVLPQSSFCISMGNLEGAVGVNEFVLSCDVDCTGTININTLRGGVVNTDGVAMTTNLEIPFTITVDSGICLGDLDGNGFIDIADLSAVVAILSPHAGTTPAYTVAVPAGKEAADVNEDGFVDIADLSAIVSHLTPFAGSTPAYTSDGCIPSI
ncbi:MAG: hypothetical protein KAS23_09855 [Anaerohalosphaera sp.]|nr:hypothetical protein [Anaerohalosphaera sp.]